MSKTDLKNLLNKIGKGIFVQYFHEFGDSSISSQTMIALLQSDKLFTLKSCASRTYKSRRIFREGLEKEALSIIAESHHVEQKVAAKALALLASLRAKGTDK